MTDFVITNNEKNARKYLYATAINIGAGSTIVFPSRDLKSPPKKDFTPLVTNKKPSATVSLGFVSALDQIRTSKRVNQKKKLQANKKFLPTSNKVQDKNTKLPQRAPKKQTNRSLQNRKNSFSKNKKKNNKKSHLKTNLYKTEICRSWVENGYCKYGEKCQFAHGTSELRKISRHPKYKTQICKPYHQSMFCTYGIRCRFIHTKTQPVSQQQPKTITKRLPFFKTITERK
ncbi:protein tis11 [Anaeramoeba flamelloides]|uniref:Protein tis11 n=1 Tax=Anaeramoeba flamelloides TaxID=1746091 RepID=A0AAV7ZP26_9EUKA|nr:protein tis11 [Anaeramoeba flamelloides]|eukprot:Anaeramoba_flamelloidesc39225_g2_i1.p1 GENE.c39225_g2_i1~~c39225_g2_i1.p1  ORF type:complete len:230 (-),score=37.85 c39225_g2_i1:46-735(-)